MKRPDYIKMRRKLSKNVGDVLKEDFARISDGDILYEYIKVFGQHKVPKEDIK